MPYIPNADDDRQKMLRRIGVMKVMALSLKSTRATAVERHFSDLGIEYYRYVG